jgi:putative ABC transport system substrate-binding protein
LSVFAEQAKALNAEIVIVLSYQNSNFEVTLKKYFQYLDKNNVSYSVTKFNLSTDNPEKILIEIKNRKPDIVLALGTNAFNLLKDKITDTPIVFSYCYVSVGTQLNPNIYGIRLNIPAKKQLEMLKKVAPGKKRVGVFYSKNSAEFYNEISEVCETLGFELVSQEIQSDRDFASSVMEIGQKIDCFLIVPDSSLFFVQSLKYLFLESLRQKFMVIGLSSYFTKAGALMSLESDYGDLGRQEGEITIKILKNETQGIERIQGPQKLNYSINELVAERLDIKVNSSVIDEANEVFGK